MKAKLEIETENPDIILGSIEPDLEQTERFEVSFKKENNKIIMDVKATDITALLAGINSYLKLIKTSMELIKNE